MWICFSSLIFYQCFFETYVFCNSIQNSKREKSKRKDLSLLCDVFLPLMLLLLLFSLKGSEKVSGLSEEKLKLLNSTNILDVRVEFVEQTLNGFCLIPSTNNFLKDFLAMWFKRWTCADVWNEIYWCLRKMPCCD